MCRGEVAIKRAIAFLDGQNLFHAARLRFGVTRPNYHPRSLAREVCAWNGWTYTQTRFYTGIHRSYENPIWYGYWARKLSALQKYPDVYVFQKELSYVTVRSTINGKEKKVRTAREKGIDVRISLDIVGLARRQEYDVAIIFSEDTDFIEVVKEVKAIAAEQNRLITIACAFPYNDLAPRPGRGIPGTQWIKISRHIYEACLDKKDFFDRS